MPNPIKDLASHFDGLYQAAHEGVRYPFHGGKDARILKELREIYSDGDLRRYMAVFFASDDEFIQSSGYSLGVFRGCLAKVIAEAQRLAKRAPRDWACPHMERCGNRQMCAHKVMIGPEKYPLRETA